MPEEQRFVREACRGDESAASLCRSLELPIRNRRVQKIHPEITYLKYRKMVRVPKMSAKYLSDRFSWARLYVHK